MKYGKLKNLKGIYSIYAHKHYVILLGEELYIFDGEGREVACRDDISNAHKLHILPTDTIFVSDGCGEYHLISLKNGQDIWTVARPKYEYSAKRFAYDEDTGFLYDYYCYKGKYFIVRINIQAKDITEYRLDVGLQAIKDILCDEFGVPCLLLTNYMEVSGKQISENGVLYQHQDSIFAPSAYFWKYRWTFQSNRIACYFLDDTNTILTNDLYVYSPKTGECYYLLENEPNFQLPKVHFPSGCTIDQSKRYIILNYGVGYIVVDWQARRVVAQYVADGGDCCIMNDEFWHGGSNGIVRRPFPIKEDLPPQKHRFWNNR